MTEKKGITGAMTTILMVAACSTKKKLTIADFEKVGKIYSESSEKKMERSKKAI